MKKLLAVAIASALAVGAACAQNTGGDKKKVTDKAALNPQPLPPGAKKTTENVSAADKTALNPQPLPPGKKTTSASEKVSLNPQPLPPGPQSKSSSPAEKVALNPQPLPPKSSSAAKKGTVAAKSKKGSASGSATAGTTPK